LVISTLIELLTVLIIIGLERFSYFCKSRFWAKCYVLFFSAKV